MANFISDFFENRGWLGVVQQNATTGALEVGGADVAVTNADYDTVALLNAATPATGTVSLLNPAAFTGTGKPTAPIPMIYTGSRWEPLGGMAKLFKCQFGTKAVPTMTASSVARFTLATEPIIPGGLISANGDSLTLIARYQHNGTAAGIIVKPWLGTSATYTSNSPLAASTTATTDLAGVTVFTEVTRITSTTAFTSSSGTINVNHATGFFGDRNTLLNFAADQYFTIAIDTVTAPDTLDLLSFEIVWKTGTLV